MQETVNVEELKPNPHRNTNRYPINEQKIEELMSSYDSTGYWGNIIGRKNGAGYEIAFGHHRLEALRRKGIKKAEIIVRELSELEMLKMMADENSENWGSGAAIDQETIRAVVQAHADEKIDLLKGANKSVRGKCELRAPSVQRTKDAPGRGHLLYSQYTVASFLKWTKKKGSRNVPNARFQTAWKSLELIEEGVLKDSDFKGLSRNQALATNTQGGKVWSEHQQRAKRFEAVEKRASKMAEEATDTKTKSSLNKTAAKAKANATEAKKDAKKETRKAVVAVTKGLRGKSGVRDAASLAKSATKKKPTVQAPPKSVEQLADKISRKIFKMLDGDLDNRLSEELKTVIQYRYDCPKGEIDRLAKNLRSLASRCEKFAVNVQAKATAKNSVLGIK